MMRFPWARDPCWDEGLMVEEWRDIPGVLGKWQVSSLGRVRTGINPETGARPAPMFPKIEYVRGYHRVTLDGWRVMVHRLVAEAFLGEPDDPARYQVAHNDGDTSNNHVKNLRWATPKENAADRHIHGTAYIFGRKTLDPESVREIRRLRAAGMAVKQIGNMFGVDHGQVSRICNRKAWKHVV